MEYKIDGLQAITDRLKAMPDKIQTKVLRGSIRDEAVKLREIAKSNCDRFKEPTGQLKKSIKVRNARTGDRNSIAFKVGPVSDKKKGKDVFYGRFVEFGTVHATAKPFMRPTFDSQAPAVLANIKSNLTNRLDEVTQ